MAQSKSTKTKRRRGVILTPQGLEKLQNAKSDAEYLENHGNRYTLEALSGKTVLAVDTLMKVFACESGVDKQTLKNCFKAFNLTLTSEDFYHPQLPSTEVEETVFLEPELPEGQVPLDSKFYIQRSPVESNCYKAILQPGALIRLKAARRMGKSSLLARIVNYGKSNGCSAVSLSLQLADKNLFQDLDKFLQWFCANISLSLQLPNKITDYWDDLFGSKISCKIYWEQYILANLKTPLVLALDDVDRLFQYPDLADDFFALLRAWHEEGKNRDIWKKLRLVVVHSSEVYIPLNVNHSPFNVGISIELPLLNPEQVQDLAQRYELTLSLENVKKLMGLVEGNPYLIRLALYHIWRKDVSLEGILNTDFQSPNHIYSDHLQRQLYNLQRQDSELLETLEKVVFAPEAIELDLLAAIKLQSCGLVNLKGNQVIPNCRLYQEYFRQYFQSNK